MISSADSWTFRFSATPHSCILDPEWFYDTNFHLNESGRQLNTRNLTRDLKAQLGDTSPTEIAVPRPARPGHGRDRPGRQQ